ncbi:putative signal peptide protein [Psychrobacter aquaticus CMS 56]|uniref:Putative signal peptide protein n=2 Tax=Psychrobacter TaxID=497 RepID=U4T8T7_9GAMM|nr:putative signal peptide protein [Psychrobacter aquaticus CMS 56]
MKFNKKLLAATLVTAGGFAAISSANAETAGSTFEVGMTVEKLCTVSTAGEISLNPTATNVNATAKSTTFNVACSQGTPYSITMSPTSGTANSGAGVLTGENTLETLAYTLSEASGGAVWDAEYKTGVVGAGFVVDPTPYTVFVNLTEDSRKAKPDTYTDTVAVSVGY